MEPLKRQLASREEIDKMSLEDYAKYVGLVDCTVHGHHNEIIDDAETIDISADDSEADYDDNIFRCKTGLCFDDDFELQNDYDRDSVAFFTKQDAQELLSSKAFQDRLLKNYDIHSVITERVAEKDADDSCLTRAELHALNGSKVVRLIGPKDFENQKFRVVDKKIYENTYMPYKLNRNYNAIVDKACPQKDGLILN